MKDLKSFLDRMGGLHDSVVHELAWSPATGTLRLMIEDLCSNFEGLPEYPGVVPGDITLYGVSQVNFVLETSEERLNIYEFVVDPCKAAGFVASITFWPSGRMTVVYSSADFPEVALAGDAS